MKIGFDVKWGHNEIEIPVNQGKPIYDSHAKGLSRLKNKMFTIINRIPTSADDPQITAWVKRVIDGCDVQNGLYDKTNGTMIYKSNTWTAWVDDWERYKPPMWVDDGFYALADKTGFYTANTGDLLIFGAIDDPAPTTTQEFQTLMTKYRDMGGLITGVQAYINYRLDGTPWRTNHIEIVKG